MALRGHQTFTQHQSQALLEAQQKIHELQSAQNKAENDRENLLQELQALKVTTP